MLSSDYKLKSLSLLKQSLTDCDKCKLCKFRTNIVFGEGNPDAKLVFVGEGPGKEEDIMGSPFVGAAGIILTKMLFSLGLKRNDVYIANVVKCRPPNNRNPELDEIDECKKFLFKQLKIINPKVVCTLGAVSTNLLTNRKEPISKVRGKVFKRDNFIIVPTFHPAYLYRTYSKKSIVWEDLKLIEKLLKEEEVNFSKSGRLFEWG